MPENMQKIFLIVLTLWSTNLSAQVINESETNLPIEGSISEGLWGTYLLSNTGSERTLRLGVSNDGYTRAEIEMENNNSISGNIIFKTTNSNSTSGALQRMIIADNGNVGIGTTSLNAKFNIVGQDIEFYSGTNENTLKFGRNSNEYFKFYVNDNHGFLDYIQDADENSSHVFYIRNLSGGNSVDNDIRFRTSNIDRISIKPDGKIGIGTTSPTDKLELSDFLGGVLRLSNSSTQLSAGSIAGKINFYKDDASYGAGVVSYIQSRSIDAGGSYALDFATGDAGSGGNPIISRMTINYNGNVGIGTKTPQYKLAVKGTVGCGEVIVEDISTWSDFVFSSTYALISLEDLEQYIKTNKHLPDVPSEKEVKENGLSLGQSDAVLLQKIEELTLYLIEQNKVVKSEKLKVESLQSEIRGLKAENQRLQKVEGKYAAQQSILTELMKRVEKLERKK